MASACEASEAVLLCAADAPNARELRAPCDGAGEERCSRTKRRAREGMAAANGSASRIPTSHVFPYEPTLCRRGEPQAQWEGHTARETMEVVGGDADAIHEPLNSEIAGFE